MEVTRRFIDNRERRNDRLRQKPVHKPAAHNRSDTRLIVIAVINGWSNKNDTLKTVAISDTHQVLGTFEESYRVLESFKCGISMNTSSSHFSKETENQLVKVHLEKTVRKVEHIEWRCKFSMHGSMSSLNVEQTGQKRFDSVGKILAISQTGWKKCDIFWRLHLVKKIRNFFQVKITLYLFFLLQTLHVTLY